MVQFRCRHTGGQFVVKLEGSSVSLGDLRARIREECNWSNVEIKAGFPPKLISGEPSQTLKSLGLQSGNLMIKELEGSAQPTSSSEFKSQPPSASSSSSSRPSSQQSSAGSATTDTSSSPPSPSSSSPRAASAASIEGHQMVKREVPSDNSCLFVAFVYAIEGRRNRSRADELRQVIASVILSQPEVYSEAMLGKPAMEYVQWISDTEHWGGSIELSILSKLNNVEITAIDIANGRFNTFGEHENFSKRIYLLYDGIHYDALALTPSASSPESSDVTIFSPDDFLTSEKARHLASEAKRNRQFTDVHSFTLRCLDCGTGLVGQKEAQQHAKQTRHVNFSEY